VCLNHADSFAGTAYLAVGEYTTATALDDAVTVFNPTGDVSGELSGADLGGDRTLNVLYEANDYI
jgi:hypothetical protein